LLGPGEQLTTLALLYTLRSRLSSRICTHTRVFSSAFPAAVMPGECREVPHTAEGGGIAFVAAVSAPSPAACAGANPSGSTARARRQDRRRIDEQQPRPGYRRDGRQEP
jgi:hypothetical protein